MNLEKRLEALEANRPPKRLKEVCAHCGSEGEMNLHTLDGEDKKDELAFCDSACSNAYELELGHVEPI